MTTPVPTECTETHTLYFSLPLPIPSKKNSRTAHLVQSRLTGKWRNYISNSTRWKEYEQIAVPLLKGQMRRQCDVRWEHYTEQVYVAIHARYKDKRVADIANIFDGVSDLLQDAGVIENDRNLISASVLRSTDGDGDISITLIPASHYQLTVYYEPVSQEKAAE